MAMETDDPSTQNILEFIREKEDNDLCEQWQEILMIKNIPQYMRVNNDLWFQKCYQERKDLIELRQDVSHEIAMVKAERLYDELTDNKIDKIIQLSLKSRDPVTWVKDAINCVEKEIELIEQYKKKIESQQLEKNRFQWQQMEAKVEAAKYSLQQINLKIEKLKHSIDFLIESQTKQQEKEQRLQAYKEVVAVSTKNTRNGTKGKFESLQSGCKKYITAHNYEADINQGQIDVSQLENELYDLFAKLKDPLEVAKSSLCEEVIRWRDQFKHWYVEIGDKPVIDDLAQWCGELGRIINDASIATSTWSQIVTAATAQAESLNQYLQQLLLDFYNSTFIITEQDGYIVKVDKKNLPKFTIRVLASENLNQDIEVEALFLLEDDINSCCHGNGLDMDQLRKKSTKLDAAKQRYKCSTTKKKGSCEVVFKDLHFKDKKFNRPGKKPVHEEKYRVVFVSTASNMLLAPILSLPLVVTTGANQNCLALASTMWQCFSTDVYKVPIPHSTDLPWTRVAEMLQMKMLKLCPKRELNVDNFRHLKRRLLHGEELSDDTLISFKRFSEDPMPLTGKHSEMCNFSFWKWFLANYNLLEKYMLDYWKDGLIEGYLSKEDAENKFRTCRSFKAGVFILRFSDNNIVNSQGIKSVYGTLTASVQSFTEEDGEKKKKINHLDLGGHSKQKDKNLANILKETFGKNSHQCVFQYIYPGTQRREDLFDKYCKKDVIVEGYTGVRDQFVVDLEQIMEALKITTGKHRSPSCDSDSVRSVLSSASSKRSRNSTEQFQTIRNLLQTASPAADLSDSHSDVLSNISSPQQPFSPTDANADFSHMQITPPMQMNQTSTLSMENLQQLNLNLPTVVPDNLNNEFCAGNMTNALQSHFPVSMQYTITHQNAQQQFNPQAPSPGGEVEIGLNPGMPFLHQQQFIQEAPSPCNEVEIGPSHVLSSTTDSVIALPIAGESFGNDPWSGAMDNNPDDFIQRTNSSGSMSAMQLNLSEMELAEIENVNSGNIDTKVFESDFSSSHS